MQREIVFKDKVIKCRDCEESFVFTAGEQSYYWSKGLRETKRCPACRELRKRSVIRVEVADGK